MHPPLRYATQLKSQDYPLLSAGCGITVSFVPPFSWQLTRPIAILLGNPAGRGSPQRLVVIPPQHCIAEDIPGCQYPQSRSVSCLDGTHASKTQADTKEAVAEARLRLLAGLKRYFHSKAAEGLLSGTVCVLCVAASLSRHFVIHLHPNHGTAMVRLSLQAHLGMHSDINLSANAGIVAAKVVDFGFAWNAAHKAVS